MPSVKEGKELTGLSRRNVAVELLFLSESGPFSPLEGTLNWKNSYSARLMSHRFCQIYRLVISYLLPSLPDLVVAVSGRPSLEDHEGMRRPAFLNLGRRS